MKRKLILGLAWPALVLGQAGLGGIFNGLPVIDYANLIQTSATVLRLADQILIQNNQLGIQTQQQLWLAQVVLNKLPWGVQYPLGAQNSTAVNTIGEMALWTPALATGLQSQTAWQEAIIQLANLAPVLLNQTVGSPIIANLATKEAIDAAGTNNLAIIGSARSYMTQTVPAWNALQSQILDPNPANNGPTQQMQYVAAGVAQNQGTAVQNLQVNTGILESVTALSTTASSTAAYDLNIQAKQQLTYMTQPTGVGGMGTAFMNAGATWP